MMALDFPDFRSFSNNVEKSLGGAATLHPSAKIIASLEPDMPADRALKIFTMLRKFNIDDSLRLTLLFPQELQLYWQCNDAMGELFLSNISQTCNRRVDPSQHNLEFFGAPLSDFYIVDEVANVGGPFFTLVKKVGSALEEQLYFFDTRNCSKLSIGFKVYLDLAMKSFAPLYWQCLFIDEKLTTSRTEALQKSLEWLSMHAPSDAVEMLKQRLKEKSALG
jgi:hypothetical protein